MSKSDTKAVGPEHTKARLVCITVACGTLCSLLLSSTLWTSYRLYAVVPIFEFLSAAAQGIGAVPLFVLSFLLVALLFAGPKRILLVSYILVAILFGLLDQNRLQPWFFHSMLFFFALAASQRRMDLCRLIIAGTYVWSGLQKFNFVFVSELFPWLVSPFIDASSNAQLLAPFAILVPIVETAIGLLLFFRATRRGAAFAAILMHLGILLSIGPFGHNWNIVVWPWNLEMCVLCYVLFIARSATHSQHKSLIPSTFAGLVVSCFVLLLPALNFVGFWDAYLSFALYSGNTSQASLGFGRGTAEKLPYWLTNRASVGGTDQLLVDFRDWAIAETGVPPYPEPRVMRQSARALCSRLQHPKDLFYIETARPDARTGERTIRTYSCADLENEKR